MSATIYNIESLRHRRAMLAADAKRDREARERSERLRRLLDGGNDRTPPDGGWAA